MYTNYDHGTDQNIAMGAGHPFQAKMTLLVEKVSQPLTSLTRPL